MSQTCDEKLIFDKFSVLTETGDCDNVYEVTKFKPTF